MAAAICYRNELYRGIITIKCDSAEEHIKLNQQFTNIRSAENVHVFIYVSYRKMFGQNDSKHKSFTQLYTDTEQQ